MDVRMLLLLLAMAPRAYAAPPVPADAAAAVVYEYRGPEGAGSYTVDEILARVRAAPTALHEVRGADAREWTAWNRVPRLAEAWLTTPAASPAAPAGPDPAAGVGPAPPGTTDDGADTPPAIAPAPARPQPARPVATVRMGGDVRIDLKAANLERLAGESDGAATFGFNVSRARPVLDAQLGPTFSGRLAVEFRQDDGTTAYTDTGVTFDVKDWADGWSVQGREIWLQAEAGDGFKHRVRVGLQEPAFGVRDRYERDYPFAGASRLDLARRTELIPDEDLGVGWRGTLGDTWAFDAQVLNGSGGTRLDQNNGKDLVVRAAVTPLDALSVSLSGLYGARGLDGSGEQAHAELAVELEGPSQRLLIEAIVGTTTEDQLDTVYSGAAASGLWAFPLRGAEAVEVVGRFQFYDPVAGLALPDAWWGPAAGAWYRWAPGDHTVRIGATWEMHVPQDSLLAVEHTAIAEAAWAF